MLLIRIRYSNSSLYPSYLRTALSAMLLMARGSRISIYLYNAFSTRNHFLRPIRRHLLYAAKLSTYISINISPSLLLSHTRTALHTNLSLNAGPYSPRNDLDQSSALLARASISGASAYILKST